MSNIVPQNTISVIVTENMTLAGLCRKYLGSIARLDEVAVLNNLRPPYISTKVLEQYGPPRASVNLTGTLSSGATSVALSLPAYSRVGDVLVFVGQGATDGAPFSDVVTVTSIVSGTFTFTPALAYTYPTGNQVYLCYNPIGRPRVLRPGQTILIPTSQGNRSNVEEQNLKELYGSDIACGGPALATEQDGGYHMQFDENGALVMVSGTDNLIQLIQHVIQTPLGSVPHNPTLGCSIWNYLGHVATAGVIGILRSLLADELTADPRITGITKLDIQLRDSSVFVTGTLQAAGVDSRVTNPIDFSS